MVYTSAKSKTRLIAFLAAVILFNISCTKEPDTDIALDETSINLNHGQAETRLDPGIALTFDDAYFDDWLKMLPILKKYNAKATFFISLNYPAADINCREKILNLYNAGNEIGVHTMNHPHLSDYLKHHSMYDYYKYEIWPEMLFLKSCGIRPTSFAWPFGEQNPESNNYLSQYFNKIRCMYGNAYINKVQKVIGSSAILTTNLIDYKSEILSAQADSSIWVLLEHRPVQKAAGGDTFTYAMLDSVCRFVSEHNMRFYCLQEIDSLILKKQGID